MNDAIKKLIIFPLYFVTGKTLPGYRLPLWRSVLIHLHNQWVSFWADLRSIACGEVPRGRPVFGRPARNNPFWEENRRGQLTSSPP